MKKLVFYTQKYRRGSRSLSDYFSCCGYFRVYMIVFLFILLFNAGCKERGDQSAGERFSQSVIKEYDVKAEAVITGHITNREVYPQQKNIRLKIPGYGASYIRKTAEIDPEGNFSFRFFPYGVRDVAIETFVPYLILRPGDSLHLEIDFRRLSSIRFSGTAGKINTELFTFTDKGYYIEPYSGGVHWEWSKPGFQDEVRVIRKEMEERKKAYLKKYTPEPEVLEWINQTLDIDYYMVMMAYPWRHAVKKGEKPAFDKKWYAAFISRVEQLYDGKITNSKLYDLTLVYWSYFNLKLQQEEFKITKQKDIRSYIERLIVGVNNAVLREYLITMLFNYLVNNPGEFQKNLDLLNTYLTIPQLKYPLLEVYRIKSKNAYSLP